MKRRVVNVVDDLIYSNLTTMKNEMHFSVTFRDRLMNIIYSLAHVVIFMRIFIKYFPLFRFQTSFISCRKSIRVSFTISSKFNSTLVNKLRMINPQDNQFAHR